jgi:hypothetical protein
MDILESPLRFRKNDVGKQPHGTDKLMAGFQQGRITRARGGGQSKKLMPVIKEIYPGAIPKKQSTGAATIRAPEKLR